MERLRTQIISKEKKELYRVVFFALSIVVISVWFDYLNFIDHFFEKEALKLDRLFSTLFLLSLILLWYGYKRHDELRKAQKKLIQKNQIIYEQAYYDPLTALPNRALLYDRAKVAIEHARRHDENMALMFLDLDNFKNINDSMGHDIGDALLKEVASILKSCVRSNDTVARLGGDEFVVLCCDASKEKLSQIASNIIAMLNKKIELGKYSFYATTSIGIGMFPHDGKDLSALLKSADIAMYQAKSKGKNAYEFFCSSHAEVVEFDFELERDIFDAIKNKEIKVFYQPQVDVENRKIVGAEALLRWEHPKFGVIPPSRFIPIAENNGFIIELGAYVLRKACMQQVLWRAMGEEVRMSVNISIRQFQNSNLYEVVKQTLKETGMRAQDLELEITENLVMLHKERNIETLKRLKGLGVTISMDDFGTGYSSLSYIKDLPIDTLKIDQAFINNILETHTKKVLVKTIIDMSEGLGLKVIAEGVEKPEQLHLLEEYGCMEFQGFYFSKPLLAKDLQTLLKLNVA